ncbi:hypothetical protein [Streptomyces stelliscabiei]|uniref:hypothetical protein n=1 Tax=Streptomyces stelliscabiei TaxID=146820 RepID=UPI002FF22732
MCETTLTGPGYVVDGASKHRRTWWRAQLLICQSCYDRGIDPETGLTLGYAAQRTARHQWINLVGRGKRLLPSPCAACGQLVVRNGDPLLKRVTCSRSCSTSLTRSRNGGKGSGQPCETCGEPIATGRADSRYCGSACRQKAYRRRARDRHAQP